MEDIHNRLNNLKDFIKSKTDLGATNYIMKEINEVCGMVETEQLRQYNVVRQSEQLVCDSCTDGWILEIDEDGIETSTLCECKNKAN